MTKPFSINPDISKASTIDTDFYTEQKYFELSKEKIFLPSWQFIGDTDMVKDPGSAVPFVLLEKYIDEPLLLTRDKQNKIHCLSNVCTHRGNILIQEKCKTSQIN